MRKYHLNHLFLHAHCCLNHLISPGTSLSQCLATASTRRPRVSAWRAFSTFSTCPRFSSSATQSSWRCAAPTARSRSCTCTTTLRSFSSGGSLSTMRPAVNVRSIATCLALFSPLCVRLTLLCSLIHIFLLTRVLRSPLSRRFPVPFSSFCCAAYFSAALNSGIHVIMYAYYFWAAITPKRDENGAAARANMPCCQTTMTHGNVSTIDIPFSTHRRDSTSSTILSRISRRIFLIAPLKFSPHA
jgi:hypothetical protein